MRDIAKSPQDNAPKIFNHYLMPNWASLVVQMVNCLPAIQETLGWEDPLEKG